MKKQLLISFLPLFTIASLFIGCEKTKSVTKEKNQVEKSVTEKKTPSKKTTAEPKYAEILPGKEKSVAIKNIPATEDQKFEGSQTLKRYMDDSP